MDWTYNGKLFDKELIDEHISFVYAITNKLDGRAYIGKKNFYRAVTKAPLKGKKRKRRSRATSDWETYYGSNEELQQDVIKLGADNFEREILRLCNTKGESTYYEAKYQFEYDAIISDKYYNTWIYCRIRKDHLVKKKALVT